MAGSIRVERGIYELTDAGHAALKRWPQQPIEVIDAGELVPADRQSRSRRIAVENL